MEVNNLNLAGLSEEELLHIQEVLSRDRKLQENSHLINLTINNNTETNGKPTVTANDLVTAEIDRIHGMTPKSDMSGRSTPVRSDSGTNDEGFFASFADMISRGMEAIDFTSSSKKGGRSTLASFARGVIKMDTESKTPFKYNPRATVKRKPTLLELAATRRVSSPVPQRKPYIDEKVNQPYKRGISLPESQTLPRNYSKISTGFLTELTPSTKTKYIRSTSVCSDREGVSPVRSRSEAPQTSDYSRSNLLETTPKNIKNSPVRSSSTTTPDKSKVKQFAEKQYDKKRRGKPFPKRSVSEDCHDSASQYSPDSSGKLSPTNELLDLPLSSKFTVLSHDNVERGFIIPEMKESQEPRVTQSSDSGIFPKIEFFTSKDDNDSPSKVDAESRQDSTFDYEPDAVSVYDADSRKFSDSVDDISLHSASSSAYGSPITWQQGDSVQDSWDDSDASSTFFGTPRKNRNPINRITPSPHKSPWGKSEGIGRTNQQYGHLGRYEKTATPSPTASPTFSFKSTSNFNASSPVNRRDITQSPIESVDTIGNLEISLIYYSAELFNRKKRTRTEIPYDGTKSIIEKNCDVLSRKQYVEVTNADMKLDPGTKSGAPEHSDGELHVTIKRAKFQASSGKIKSQNTYVKCYLLPDKFHNSKMKSAVIKKSKEPQWDHKFILVGFSQSELRERSLEIIVGSWHFKKQEVLGGAILSVGQGGESQPWIKSTKAEAYVWKTALQISGNKVKTLLPLRAHMKPTYL